ncbi:MAG: cupin [Pseudomonadota bacterium]
MKPHREFHPVSQDGWYRPTGMPDGFLEKVLSDDLDLAAGTGSRTVLQRLAPGTATDEVVTHETSEEVYVAEGDLIVGSTRGPDGRTDQGGQRFDAPTYACRPAGVRHGPFRTEGGCLLIAFFYPTPAS